MQSKIGAKLTSPRVNSSSSPNGASKNQASALKDNVNQASVPKASGSKDNVKQASVPKASGSKDNVNKASGSKDNVNQTSAPKASAPKDNVNRASASKAIVNQASAPKDTVNQASAAKNIVDPAQVSSTGVECAPKRRISVSNRLLRLNIPECHLVATQETANTGSIPAPGLNASLPIVSTPQADTTIDVQHPLSSFECPESPQPAPVASQDIKPQLTQSTTSRSLRSSRPSYPLALSPRSLSLKKRRLEAQASHINPQKTGQAPERPLKPKRKLVMPEDGKKRRRLDLPWSRACPDVTFINPNINKNNEAVMQVSESITRLFDAVLEDNYINQCLYILQSSVSTRRYPLPKTLNSLLKVLLSVPEEVLANRTYQVLRRVLSIHPPTSPRFQHFYLQALCGDGEEQPASRHSHIWERIHHSFTVLLDEERKAEHVNHSLFLQFVVALVETNMSAIMNGCESSPGRLNVTNSVWAQILWPGGEVGGHSPAVTSIINVFLLSQQDEQEASMCVTSMLQSLIALTAYCCYTGGTEDRQVSANGKHLAQLISYQLQGYANNDPGYTQRVLTSLSLPWLRLHVVITLLDDYDDSLLPAESRDAILNMKKIVGHYFFLLPLVERPVPKSPHPKSLSVKEVALPTTPRQRRSCHAKVKGDSAPSTPAKSEAALKRKIMNINKQNRRGETALHRACMKNEYAKVNELLQTPGIDVNTSDHYGWTPLHEACNRGHVESIKELLKYRPPKTIASFFGAASDSGGGKGKKVDLMARSQDGITPLHDAVQNHHIEVVKLLLHHGGAALLRATTNEGLVALDLTQNEVLKELLIAAETRTVPASPCVTPRKRLYLANSTLDDSCFSMNSSQNSQSSKDFMALSINPPTEESYNLLLSAVPSPLTSTPPAGPNPLASTRACHTLTILLYHLLHGYMTTHQTQVLRDHVVSKSTKCVFSGGPACVKGRSHTRCLCKHLEKSLQLGEDHILEDLGILRNWRRHVEMLEGHLARISAEEQVTDRYIKCYISQMELVGV